MEQPITQNGIYIPDERRHPRTFEWLCSDAIERIAVLVGVSVDLDDPEQAVVSAVERRVAELVQAHRHLEAR